jgi:hypothetical protein
MSTTSASCGLRLPTDARPRHRNQDRGAVESFNDLDPSIASQTETLALLRADNPLKIFR